VNHLAARILAAERKREKEKGGAGYLFTFPFFLALEVLFHLLANSQQISRSGQRSEANSC
jgi:hypothetical protein